MSICVFLDLSCWIRDILPALSSVEKWNDYHAYCMKCCESMHVVHCTGHQDKFSLCYPFAWPPTIPL